MRSWVHRILHSCANVEPYITLMDTRFRAATPSQVRLMVFLYHATQGPNYRTISQLFGLGRSTISKCVHDVSRAIIQHMWSAYIRLPSSQETAQSMNRWRMQTGIPGIVGAIDGTHIAIQKPCKNGEAYFNRKSFYSLNVQGIRRRFVANIT